MFSPTSSQLTIRDYEGLSLLVVAPAGCGKTEALALRVTGLINRGSVATPRRVLVTTFSNRARDNIRDRLSSYLQPNVMRDRVTISNFHGLSARIYRAHSSVVGLDPDMLLPDSNWVAEQCRSRRLSFAATDAVQESLRIVKQEAADDASVEYQLRAQGSITALEIEQTRVAENRLTYDDLPRLAELILANDHVARLYRNHFAAVVVDEFQDLTPQQLRIVNRIGLDTTTYAGDLAQGIYSFAGARPTEIDAAIRNECSEVIEFAESHRSSPSVLELVNAMAELTGTTQLACADPISWPNSGLAGGIAFESATDEADRIVRFSRFVHTRAPNQRIGVIARTVGRRRFVDAAMAASELSWHRWDDGVLDTDTANIIKAMLTRITATEFQSASDPLAYLRQVADLKSIQDPSTRDALGSALNWCCDLLTEGQGPAAIRERIRVGAENTLLSIPGVHLLTGHLGKGQQFDWVIVVGAEDGSIPDFRAGEDADLIEEEARILSVMISRARHGVLITHAVNVEAKSGTVYRKKPSRFLQGLSGALTDSSGINDWLTSAEWDKIAAR